MRVQASEELAPPGFYLIRATLGVQMYQKDYPGGSPDYVQVIDLSQGASLRLLHGSLINSGKGEGVYGGDNPTFIRKSIQVYWNELSGSSENPFCVSNGQFFRMADSPSPLPFPLKIDNQILTDGYGIKEFPEKKLILEIWPDHVDIQPLTIENLYISSAPDIVAGLAEDASKAPNRITGRTFIGVGDHNGDQISEILYLFNTRSAKPPAAAEILRAFGASKVMMLDGGGSTQLVCQDQVLINTDRQIPQVLGVIGASAPPLAAHFADTPPYQVGLQGEPGELVVEIENRGLQTWNPDDTEIVIQNDDDSPMDRLPVDRIVLPGERISLTGVIIPPGDANIHDITLSITNQGHPIEGGIAHFQMIFLPEKLYQRRQELELLLKEWSTQEVDINTAIQNWLSADAESVTTSELSVAGLQGLQVKIRDVIWVPLVGLPIIIIIFFLIRRSQELVEWDDLDEDYQL